MHLHCVAPLHIIITILALVKCLTSLAWLLCGNKTDGLADSPNISHRFPADCLLCVCLLSVSSCEAVCAVCCRPGRVNNRLHLSYMSFKSAKQMLESLTFDSESSEQELSAPACAVLNEFFETGLKQLGFGPGSDDGELKTYKPKVTPAELLQLWQWNDSLATDSSIVQTILDILKDTINDKGSVVEDIRNRAKRDRSEEEPHATSETPRSLSRAVSKALIRVASNRSSGTLDRSP